MERSEYRRAASRAHPRAGYQPVPPVHLYEFGDAIIDGNGILILDERFIVSETIVDFPGTRDIHLGSLRFEKQTGRWVTASQRPIESFPGPALMLLKHGFDNYGHWLVELLPRLELALDHVPRDCAVVVGRTGGRMREVTFGTLRRLGIEPDRIRMVETLTRFDTLYYVSPMTRHPHPICISPYVTRFLAETFRPRAPSGTPRRLYVSRSDARFRRLLNEYEIIDGLGPLGFEVVHPGQMGFEEQVRRFGDAELVVGVMGAGLTNIVFAPPGTPVIVLRPATMVDDFYRELAGHNEQPYFEVVGPEFGRLGSIYADFTVDFQSLVPVLDLAGIDGSGSRAPSRPGPESPGPRPAGHGLAPEATLAIYCPERRILLMENLSTGARRRLTVNPGAYREAWTPLIGDWNGDGLPGFGGYIHKHGVFGLREDIESGLPDQVFRFWPYPREDFIPLAGDWTGRGGQAVGLYDPAESAFFLACASNPKAIGFTVRFGPPGGGWWPLSGDWDGDGIDSLGLYDPVQGFFHLMHKLGPGGRTDSVFQFGPAGAGLIPVAGKWDDSGKSSVGLYEEATGNFYLRCAGGAHARTYRFEACPGKSFPFALAWPRSR